MAHHPALQIASPSALRLWLSVLGVGLAWGSTGPLSKLAVSTGHSPIGITFWNTLIAAVLLTGVLILRRRRLPLDRRYLVLFLVCGLLGTALPNSLSYTAYRHLPVGINVMLISLVPMMTLLVAWPMGLERPSPRRLIGLVLGAAAVAMIVLPGSSLPDPAQGAWLILPIITALSYAGENVVIARADLRDIGPYTTMCGLSWGALILLAPTMVVTNAWFDISVLGPPERAVLGITGLHLLAYGGFIWLIGHAGPVFAAQVGYVVTGTGVLLGMVIFGERHSLWVWAALAVMVLGLALVQPRRTSAPLPVPAAPGPHGAPQGPRKT